MISFINHDSQWGRSEVVIISPETCQQPFKTCDILWNFSRGWLEHTLFMVVLMDFKTSSVDGRLSIATFDYRKVPHLCGWRFSAIFFGCEEMVLVQWTVD